MENNAYREIIQAVYQAIDEVNPLLSGKMKLDKTLDTVIFGDGGKLDSMGLVNFIVAVEDRIRSNFGYEVALSDANVISQKDGPLHTVGSLCDYISSVRGEKNGPA
ncbi:MAG: acyl carrier protein [Candidatus Omnitrophica bacterium]|nr:acyl carrier protein [Candidatus Omnitrophota bacterium]